ncbi:MAG TPA: prepilin-type N-terminal cleavage/methylation domain-containing protein [Chthoniobacterales bacterium]|nr:prepilin-type N-terminal cleavage/methylation domain-containing protein [Chthoniobacterales bacterium]
MRRSDAAFTLVEMLVSMAVLTLIVLSVARLFDNAATLTASGNKRMEADGQARSLLDRLAIDFAQMLRRSDVDYYLKTPAHIQPGNDQIAFYSEVPGYYPSTGSQSPISVVSYRINAQHRMERLGKGLLWNGVSPGSTPMAFLPLTIAATWSAATDDTADSDYEIAAGNVFRLEYFYRLTNGNLSVTPWDTNAGHSAVDGMQDVAAISIAIAAIDPKSRVLLSNTQLASLTARLSDFALSMEPGAMLAQWQEALNATNDMPRSAISGIRIYQRSFPLSGNR